MSDLPLDQVRTLLAVVDEGSFDAAAAALHVTPSAVSQRVKALEQRTGRVLVQRSKPVRLTESGAVLVRFARQLTRLEADTRAELGLAEAGAPTTLPIAVNADSLATWFRDALAEMAAWDGTAVKLRVEDQAYSQELLRRGDVLAAVTSDPTAVQGCSVDPLGALRYLPAATPAVADRWRRGDSLEWAAMPVVVFNDRDDLQYELLRRHGVEHGPPVVHQVPSTADFYAAVRIGLGWGMLPEPQARADLASGELVRLSADVIDIPLHWQRWRLDSPKLAALTAAVRAAARHLLPSAAKTSAAKTSDGEASDGGKGH